MVRTFAQDTSVSVGRSRGEIDDLLRAWGCTGVMWADEYDIGRMSLQFRWPHDGVTYMARFTVTLESREKIKKEVDAMRGSWKAELTQKRIDERLAARGRQEMRILLLWLKAALNAVEAGIVKAEEIFLPFLVGADGRTVAEIAIPRMRDLLTNDAGRLLPGKGDEHHG